MRKALTFLILTSGIAPVMAAQTVAQAVPVEKVKLSADMGMLRKVIARGDHLYVLDGQNHHVLVLRNGKTTAIGGSVTGLPTSISRSTSRWTRSPASTSRTTAQRIAIFDERERPWADSPTRRRVSV